MPNWCENSLILRCNDPVQIQRAVKAYNETRLLSEYIPEPDYMTTPVYPTFPEIVGNDSAVDPSSAWYDWRIQNWGTKWDVGRDGDCEDLDFIEISETQTEVTLSFVSAWSPPVKAMKAFEAAGFSVDLYYYEGNMCFCGLYSTDGGDQCYHIPDTAAEIRETIPDEINDLFGISESCEECAIIESWEE